MNQPYQVHENPENIPKKKRKKEEEVDQAIVRFRENVLVEQGL